MTTPKRGDLKQINGKTHRWGFKSGKWQWIRDYSKDKLSAKEGLKVKEFEGTGNRIGDWTSRTLSKMGLHNRREPSNWNKEKLKAKKERENQPPLKTWRVGNKENQQLQKERQEGKEETYTKVDKDNKDNVSDQHKVIGNETKDEFLKRTKNSPAAKAGLSDAQRWAARQKHLKWKASRNTKEGRRKRITDRLKKKIYKNPHR